MSQGGPVARVSAGSGAFNVIDEPVIRVELAPGATGLAWKLTGGPA